MMENKSKKVLENPFAALRKHSGNNGKVVTIIKNSVAYFVIAEHYVKTSTVVIKS
jgi:hypothetical protein